MRWLAAIEEFVRVLGSSTSRASYLVINCQ